MIALALLLAAPQDEAFQRVTQRLLEQTAPSVVSIVVDRTADPEGHGAGPVPGYFERPAGPCTGTVWSPDGEILTSAWNVSGEIRRITVRLDDGREFEARLLGVHKPMDVALLKIDATGLPTPPRADLSTLGQGSLVAIVGRAPDPAHPTIDVGIISAMNRHDDTSVGTDALQNYGNVGGPLLTMDGQLVGVTGHTAPQNHWGQSSGIGFACKVTSIQSVMERLRSGEVIERIVRAALGVMVSEGADGLRISEEMNQSDLEVGDVLLEVDGEAVRTRQDVRRALSDRQPGDRVTVRVRRGEEEVAVEVALTEATP